MNVIFDMSILSNTATTSYIHQPLGATNKYIHFYRIHINLYYMLKYIKANRWIEASIEPNI